MSTLLADLQAKGLLGETLVIVATEFGRTHRINDSNGRGRLDRTVTRLLAGAGMKGGQAYDDTHSDNFEGAPGCGTPSALGALSSTSKGDDASPC